MTTTTSRTLPPRHTTAGRLLCVALATLILATAAPARGDEGTRAIRCGRLIDGTGDVAASDVDYGWAVLRVKRIAGKVQHRRHDPAARLGW